MRPRGAKTGPRAPKKHQGRQKSVFFRFLSRPVSLRGCPEAAQRCPGEAQEGPKTLPRPSQGGPRDPQEAPRRGQSEVQERMQRHVQKHTVFFMQPP